MQRVKRSAANLMAALNPQCRYDRALFVIGHMRCGSTAVSNILCSRPDISGYGEAHIAYSDRAALGALAVNQARRGAWKPRATLLFDKILHSRYDEAAEPGFFAARAIFVVRDPQATIASIRMLFAAIGSSEYASDALAADYYLERVRAQLRLWERFAPERRSGLLHADLMREPDASLAAISAALRLDPPLENSYRPNPAAQRRGAGDPTASHRFTSIEGRAERPRICSSELSAARQQELESLYAEAATVIAGRTPKD